MNKKGVFSYDNLIFAGCILLSLLIRWFWMDFRSIDYNGFLGKWIDFYRQNGGWSALGSSISDYNVIYQYFLIALSYTGLNSLYAIKIFSVIFDFILAYGCVKCLDLFSSGKRQKQICFCTILLLPTVWFNSAAWAQCDSIYVCFIVWSMYFMMRGKYGFSMAFLSIAFAFKLQTVFIMPVYFYMFLKRKIKMRHIIVFILTYFATCVPAMMFGRSLESILLIYVNQMGGYLEMVLNAPTVFMLFKYTEYNVLLEKISILVAGAFVLFVAVYTLIKKREDNPKQILLTFLLFSVAVPFLLPHMHDRYFYIAEIVAVLSAFALGKKYLWVAVLVQLASLICYVKFLKFIDVTKGIMPYLLNQQAAAVFMFIALIMIMITYFTNCGQKQQNS